MRRLIKKSNFDRGLFNDAQLRQIDYALSENIEINKYLDPAISAEQMVAIFYGIKHDCDVSLYDDWKAFDDEQMWQIYRALDYGVEEVNLFAAKEFDAEKMKYIVDGLKEELPLKPFIHSNISVETIKKAIDLLEKITNEQTLEDINKLDHCESENEAKKLIRKIENAISMQQNTMDHHDEENRTSALVYFNGKFYATERHAEGINQALEERKRTTLTTTWVRPGEKSIERVTQEGDVMFCANIVDDPTDSEEGDGTDEYEAIYVIPKQYLLVGITIEEAAKVLKNSEEYGHYNIFKDDDSYIDIQTLNRVYPRLAKLKRKMIKMMNKKRRV